MITKIYSYKHVVFFEGGGGGGGGGGECQRGLQYLKWHNATNPDHMTHLAGLLVRVPFDPPKLHEVEGAGQGTRLCGVLHVLLIVQDLPTGQGGRGPGGGGGGGGGGEGGGGGGTCMQLIHVHVHTHHTCICVYC